MILGRIEKREPYIKFKKDESFQGNNEIISFGRCAFDYWNRK